MKKILIADDDESIRKIYKSYLISEGYHVLEASTGEEALVSFSDQNPDVILLDIRMPGAGGWVTNNALGQAYPNAKIIVFSCYPSHIQKEMIPAALAYYDKSSGLKELSSQLKDIFQPQLQKVL